MALHFLRLAGIILVCVFGMYLPFLPGNFDGLAVTLSFMAHLLSIVGLLFVPVGLLWLLQEARQKPSPKFNGYTYAVISLVMSAMLMIIVVLPAFFNTGFSFGILMLAIGIYGVVKITPRLKLLKQVENRKFNPLPVYLTCVPIAIFFCQVAFTNQAATYSRNLAIQNSTRLINDIERYYSANGQYPISLASLWKDYKPGVIGIEQYHYEPNGEAYNLFFEQFRFYPLGTREMVVYNKLDEQVMTSHDGWILLLPPEEIKRTRGYYCCRH